ncbi:general substrate transporter [Leptodontidium sp. MPI-SDFR-AT-0119]|nr:general substrate transporter [Leptodontidium sp. MPI-SDFR-AT-0119]
MGHLVTWFSACFLAIGGFLFGYDSGIITSTISQETFVRYFSSPSPSTEGGIVSAFQGGAILGTIINMFTGDRWGRKWAITVGSFISCTGCALQAGSINIPMLIIGRFIAGVAVGILTSVIPMFAAELSLPKHRGILSGLLQWMLSWGFLVAQWLGYGCSFSTSAFQWRFPLAFQCLPGIVLLVGIRFLSESPRWLLEKDRFDEARAILQRLHGDGTPEGDQFVELEFREIQDVIAADRAATTIRWSSILTKPTWRKRLLLGCGVQAFSALSGINVINYFGPQIYKSLGISNQVSLMIIGISGALSIVYCTIGLYILDRIGRIKPLIVSAIGQALALVVNAALSQHYNPDSTNQLRAMIAMNFVFYLFFAPLGIISWVYPAEIFPVEIRNQGNSITTFTNWTINLIFAQFSPSALKNIGFKYFYVFFVFNTVAALIYFLFYPETKGKTLEQMDEMFGDQMVEHILETDGVRNLSSEKNKAASVSHVETKV